jgi:two-component system response regulator DesR
VTRALLALSGGLVRGALAYVLSKEDDIDVVAELDDLAAVLDAIRSSRPDVTVVDRRVLGADGLRAAVRACEEAGNSRLLVLLAHRQYAALGR